MEIVMKINKNRLFFVFIDRTIDMKQSESYFFLCEIIDKNFISMRNIIYFITHKPRYYNRVLKKLKSIYLKIKIFSISLN